MSVHASSASATNSLLIAADGQAKPSLVERFVGWLMKEHDDPWGSNPDMYSNMFSVELQRRMMGQ
jgi:hypothetical protein